MIEHFSYSSAKTWEQCRSKWYRRYVLAEPDPPGVEALLGTFVHQVLEAVVITDRSVRSLPHARVAARDLWEEFSPKHPEVANSAFKKKAWHLVSNFFSAASDWNIDYWNVARTELELRVSIEGMPFLGYVDRYDSLGDGEMRIVDYKTGKVPAERYLDETFRQLYIYAAAMDHIRDLAAPSWVELVYLRGKQRFWRQVKPSDKEMALEWMLGVWRTVQEFYQGEVPPLNEVAAPSKLCGWCGYEATCSKGLNRPENLRARQHRVDDDRRLSILENTR